MKTIKPYLFTLLCLFFTSTMFISCSNENVETNDLKASQIKVEPQTLGRPTEKLPVEPYSLEENMKEFSTEYINISSRMLSIFKENKRRVLDPSIKVKINSAKNVNEVFSILNSSKTKDNAELVTLIIKKMKLTAAFVKENKSLQKMTKLQIENMLSEAFLNARAKSKIVKATSRTAEYGQCLQEFNNDIDNATNDYDNRNAEAVAFASLACALSSGIACPEAMITLAITMLIIDAEYQDDISNGIAVYEDCYRSNCSSKKKPVIY